LVTVSIDVANVHDLLKISGVALISIKVRKELPTALTTKKPRRDHPDVRSVNVRFIGMNGGCRRHSEPVQRGFAYWSIKRASGMGRRST
jgi:hypothetical protein